MVCDRNGRDSEESELEDWLAKPTRRQIGVCNQSCHSSLPLTLILYYANKSHHVPSLTLLQYILIEYLLT